MGRAVWCRNLGLALLFACALAVTLRSGDALRYSDERDYDQLARSLIQSHTFSFVNGVPTDYRPPGYPFFVAVAYLFAERPLAGKIENVLTLVLAALLLGVASQRVHPNAAAFTPYLVLAYPLLIYSASLLYPQTLGCLLLAIALLLISAERLSAQNVISAGLAYGVLILAIPYFIMLLPVMAAYMVLRRDHHLWVRLRGALLLVGGAALIVVPWTARNYADFHLLVPVSANGGSNLFMGNSPSTTPNSGVMDVLPLCNRVRPGMGIEEVDGALGKCALDWVVEHPWTAVKLYAGKVVNYFNFRNELATKEEATTWRDWLLFITYYPLLFIAIARFGLIRRYPFTRTESLIYVLYFLNAFISAIYFTRIRFRIPFDFLLIAVEAAFLSKCWQEWRAADAKK